MDFRRYITVLQQLGKELVKCLEAATSKLQRREHKGLVAPGLIDRIVIPINLFWASGIAGAFLLLWTPIWEPQQKPFWIGVSFAVMGWIFTAGVTLNNRLKQHSFDLIMRTRFESAFRESMIIIRSKFDQAEEIPKKKVKQIFAAKDKQDLDMKGALGTILNFYEVLALSIWLKDADEMILREYFRIMIRDFWKQTKHYVPLCQKHDEDMFIYLEWLCEKRWAEDSRNTASKPI